jgi:nickel-dependent lactate racemase
MDVVPAASSTTASVRFGDGKLDLRLPADRTTVVTPVPVAGAADPAAVLRSALARPLRGPRLRQLVRPGQRVAVAICDGTRPQPRREMLEAILEELDGIASPDDLVVLVATGTHRGNTPEELGAMLGPLAGSLEVVNHDARCEQDLRWCGRHGRDVPVWLNRRWLDADVRVTTGFVEPHFFAGFSGGPKLVAPGLAGLETVLTLHDYPRIGGERATWGVTVGNPVHDDVRAIAAATGVDFAFDVVLNGDQQIVRAFAGELFAMHAAATKVAAEIAMAPVGRLFDVVVTSNSGYPLDQNLYQSVKGMSAAAQVVKPGGLIVVAAECRDGFPEHGSYRQLLDSADSLPAVLERLAVAGHTTPDQWQVQVQARVQARARVVMHTAYLSDAEIAGAHLEQTNDVEGTVLEALDAAGADATVCVLPEGPQTVPYLRPD